MMVLAFSGAAYGAEADMTDVVLFLPFTFAIGLLVNYFLKAYIRVRLSLKIKLSRIMTYEVILFLIIYLIVRPMFDAGWFVIACVYYPFAYLANITELNNQEAETNYKEIFPSNTKMQFCSLSSLSLIIASALMKLIHLPFEH